MYVVLFVSGGRYIVRGRRTRIIQVLLDKVIVCRMLQMLSQMPTSLSNESVARATRSLARAAR